MCPALSPPWYRAITSAFSLRKSVIFLSLHRPIAYLLLLQMTCEHLVLYYLILNHCINNRYIFQIKSNDFYFYFIKRLKTNFIFLEWLLKRGCNRSGQLQEIRRNVRKLLLKFCEISTYFRRSYFWNTVNQRL